MNIGVNTDVFCPSISLSGYRSHIPVRYDPDTLQAHKTVFFNARKVYTDTLALYNSEIDGGNTATVLSTISSATNAFSLYLYLLTKSPWLSETALEAVADKELLTNTEFVSVLGVNASVMRDGTFVNYIQSDYTISSTNMAILMGLAAINTTRTKLEDAIACAQLNMAREGGAIIMAMRTPTDTSVSVSDSTGTGICTDSNSVYYLLDSNMSCNLDSLDVWLQNVGNVWATYERAGLYNAFGQYDMADSIFAGIKDTTQPKYVKIAYNDYAKVWNVIQSSERAGRNILSLDSAEIASLDTTSIPVLTYSTGQQLVRGITANIRRITPGGSHIIALPCLFHLTESGLRTTNTDSTGQTDIFATGNLPGMGGNLFTVYPNPTSGVVTFAYNVPEGGSDIRIVITNILGEKIMELHTGNNAGKTNWDASRQTTGVYFYEASNDNGIISNGKVVVAR